MSDERITETTDSNGNTHTTRVINTGDSSGGGAKWFFLIILLVAVGAGLYIFSQSSASDMMANNAVAEAANDVGDAANQVGDAAEDAADAVTGGQ